MPEVVPDSIEKTPTADGSVGRPESGTYGEKAELNRLKSQLPSGGGPSGPPGAGGPAPMGVGGGIAPVPGGPGRPPNSEMPPGVPGALGHPTDRPNVPGSQMLMDKQAAGSPVRQANSARDARIAMLMALANDPSVSDMTRDWAQNLLQMIDNG